MKIDLEKIQFILGLESIENGKKMLKFLVNWCNELVCIWDGLFIQVWMELKNLFCF